MIGKVGRSTIERTCSPTESRRSKFRLWRVPIRIIRISSPTSSGHSSLQVLSMVVGAQLTGSATHVPVGEDQAQHLETTRIIARNFNNRFPSSPRVFNVPETLISISSEIRNPDVGSFPRIANLRDPTKKMSKSDPSKFTRIHITTLPSDIELTFQKAASDNHSGIHTAPDRPAINNLFQILSAFEDTPIETLEEEFAAMPNGGGIQALKERTAKAVIQGLEPVRERYEKVKGDKDWLERVRRQGNEKARGIAGQRIKLIKEIVGLTHE